MTPEAVWRDACGDVVANTWRNTAEQIIRALREEDWERAIRAARAMPDCSPELRQRLLATSPIDGPFIDLWPKVMLLVDLGLYDRETILAFLEEATKHPDMRVAGGTRTASASGRPGPTHNRYVLTLINSTMKAGVHTGPAFERLGFDPFGDFSMKAISGDGPNNEPFAVQWIRERQRIQCAGQAGVAVKARVSRQNNSL